MEERHGSRGPSVDREVAHFGSATKFVRLAAALGEQAGGVSVVALGQEVGADIHICDGENAQYRSEYRLGHLSARGFR